MKVLVIGGGGREHAMVRALATTLDQDSLFIAPGNPGTAALATNLDMSASDLDGLVSWARDNEISLVIPGPEQPLVDGIADKFKSAGIACCGPQASAARLEGSKIFTRQVTTAVKVPAPEFAIVKTHEELDEALNNWKSGLPVIKADGLAAGKGVFLPEAMEECRTIGHELLDGKLGEASKELLLEERLFGIEASLFFACNGREAVALPHARDHKRLNDNDEGPNTGGMGAISPNPIITDKLLEGIVESTIQPTLKALDDNDASFVGFLFAGFMLTKDGPKLLEYNVRLGDPEAQAILPRLEDGEFLRLCLATAKGNLEGFKLEVRDDHTCAVVVTAAGYPDATRKGDSISVGEELESENRWLIHAGTKLEDATLLTNGGRVAAIVARAPSTQEAITQSYDGLPSVKFDGKHYRTDIGANKEGSL